MFLSSCQLNKAIEYGKEACDYCTMTIVDPQHAAMLVTDKGRLYKFDAIECMIYYHREHPKDYSEFLVSNYTSNGSFIDAKAATFLVSKDIPSPMGAFLSAFQTKDDIHSLRIKDQKLYTWKEISQDLKSNRF